MQTRDQITFNKFLVVTILSCLLLLVYAFVAKGETVNKEAQKILEEYNKWASILGSEYSFDAIRKNTLGASEYLIIVKMNTHPTSLEAIIASKGDNSSFLFLSPQTSRAVSCVGARNSIDMRVVNNRRLFELQRTSEAIHPFFTIIEAKKSDGSVDLYAFDSFDDLGLRREIYRLESIMLRSMLSNCIGYNVSTLR